MPVLDTVVLFAAADPKDKAHSRGLYYLDRLKQTDYYVACFALVEFDIVLKSRGYKYEERMTRHALLAKDFPLTNVKVRPLSPELLYVSSKLEGEEKIDYFDAAIAAEAKMYDGQVVSSDRVFDRLSGVHREWSQ